MRHHVVAHGAVGMPRATLMCAILAFVAGCGGRVSEDAPGIGSEPKSPDHAPVCDATCTGRCADGRCLLTLASRQGTPFSLVLDEHNVYWTNRDPGSVMKVPKTGGTPVTLAGTNEPWGVAVDSERVYWTSLALRAVLTVPIDGGT